MLSKRPAMGAGGGAAQARGGGGAAAAVAARAGLLSVAGLLAAAGPGARAGAAAVPVVFVSISGFSEAERAALTVLAAPGGPHGHPSSPVYLGALALRETTNCSEAGQAAGEGGVGSRPEAWFATSSTRPSGPTRCSSPALRGFGWAWPGAHRVQAGTASPGWSRAGRPGWSLAFGVRGGSSQNASGERRGLGGSVGTSRMKGSSSTFTRCRAQNGTFVPAAEFATAFIGGMAAAMGELRRLEPAWPILWSPSARENPGQALDELAFAAAAARFHAAVGLDEIHVQDSVGKASALMPNCTAQYMTGCEHASRLVEVLGRVPQGPVAAVNMELFLRTRPHFGPGARHGCRGPMGARGPACLLLGARVTAGSGLGGPLVPR